MSQSNSRELTNMKKVIAATLSLSLVTSGCATSSKDLPTAYVSPLQYNGYDCSQLSGEVQRVQSRIAQLGGRLDEAASNDKALTGVGLILFWPVLFALGGTKQQEAEYSRLKGEYDAVTQATVLRKCPGIVVPVQDAATETGDGSVAASAGQ
jgi:hypothetical protein